MNMQKLFIEIVIALFFTVSPDAGSDFKVSNRFSLGDKGPVFKPTNKGFDKGSFHISVVRKHRSFIFSIQQPGNDITAQVYSVNGQKVHAPVKIRHGMWCWTPQGQSGRRCGAGCYLVIFECGKKRSTLQIIVEP
ncbi:MAG TPA: hypothetical protein VHO70_11385 [Chitinispirillaceae bacterium]|nr:hypothetical protein [Chitinispirillaceae bacterium]